MKMLHFPNILAWVQLAPGVFTYQDASRHFLRGEADTNTNQLDLWVILESMVEQGLLERVGNARGRYRVKDDKLVKMDIFSASVDPEPIWLPFGAQKLVNIYPGNIITIGGEKESGKTALSLNIAFDNRDKYTVHYFNSEMGPEECRVRCAKYSESHRISLREWEDINFYERSDNFADVVFPGKGNLNIIDFYECHGEFYEMGRGIRDIHDRLDGAVCVLNIQKNKGADLPLGGARSLEKTRLHFSLMRLPGEEYPHRLRIDLGKNWAQEKLNPRGLYVDYKLGGGCFLKAKIHIVGGKPKHWQVETN